MAVDLSDLIDSLRREISPPGIDLFPAASEDELVGHLQDAFWAARMRGALGAWTESDGVVVPVRGNTDMPRELQQLIVLMAGLRIVRSALRNANTVFRSKAGPVEFERQQSATTLKELLQQLNADFKDALDSISSADVVTAAYFDAVIGRSQAIASGETWFVR